MAPHDADVPEICTAIKKAIEDSDLSQEAIADRLAAEAGRRFTQQTISNWAAHTEPKPSRIAQIERALGLPTGYLYISAGLVKCPTTTREAIRADPALRGKNAKALVEESYDSILNRLGVPPTRSADSRKRSTS